MPSPPPAPRSSDSSGTTARQRIALVAFGLVLTALVLEVGLRVGGRVFLWLQEHRNQASFRADHPLVILCIGESTTALGGVDAYPSQLERALARRAGHAVASVVNAGVPGTDTDVILGRLPGLLDRYHPDMVVAMIGINDPTREVAAPNPFVAWLASLRAVKLGLLVVTRVTADWRGHGADARPPASNPALAERRLLDRLAADASDDAAFADLAGLYVAQHRDAEARALLASAAPGPRQDVARLLAEVMGAPVGDLPGEADVVRDLAVLFEPGVRSDVIVLGISATPSAGVTQELIRHTASDVAERLARAGRAAEGEQLLQRFGFGASREADDVYYGWLARLAHSRGDTDGFERYLALAESLRPADGRPTTAKNYRALRRLLAERGVTLVAVQYPLRKLQVLRRMLDDDPSVVFVDDEALFKTALRDAPYERFFVDSFAGDFGHMTAEGNRLLADNVAAAILARLPTAHPKPR